MSRKDQIMSNETGELFEEAGKMRFEWRISDFTSLSKEIGKVYYSPKFHFANVCWCLRIHPDGGTAVLGRVGLYLCRLDCGPPKGVTFSLAFKYSDGTEETLVKSSEKFSQEAPVCGKYKLLELSDLLNRKSELVPLDVLTVICTLESDAYQHTESSLFRRLWNLSLRMKNILTTRNRTDVVLKLSEGEISAHRIILESRSAVFNRIFDVDMRETQTGEVNTEDGKKETFEVVLSYIYSGNTEGLCTENVCQVYRAADKYDLPELTRLCVDYIQECLTVDTVTDIIALATLHHEPSLKECAKDYFAKHKTEVFESAKWKQIESENPALVFEVVKYVFGE